MSEISISGAIAILVKKGYSIAVSSRLEGHGTLHYHPTVTISCEGFTITAEADRREHTVESAFANVLRKMYHLTSDLEWLNTFAAKDVSATNELEA